MQGWCGDTLCPERLAPSPSHCAPDPVLGATCLLLAREASMWGCLRQGPGAELSSRGSSGLCNLLTPKLDCRGAEQAAVGPQGPAGALLQTEEGNVLLGWDSGRNNWVGVCRVSFRPHGA